MVAAVKKTAKKTAHPASKNVELIRGVRRLGRVAAFHKRRGWVHMKKGDTRTPEQKKEAAAKKAEAKKSRKPFDIAKPYYYPSDDKRAPLRSRKAAPRPAKLRSTITPGTLVILLAGRHRGKRVVFLKQLASGLLLVTGPFCVNGVPIRRVNQAYVIATRTKIDVSSLDVSKIDDEFFRKSRQESRKDFLSQPHPTRKTKQDKTAANIPKRKINLPEFRKAEQKRIDAVLKPAVEAVPELINYMRSRFSLSNGQKPHLLQY